MVPVLPRGAGDSQCGQVRQVRAGAGLRSGPAGRFSLTAPRVVLEGEIKPLQVAVPISEIVLQVGIVGVAHCGLLETSRGLWPVLALDGSLAGRVVRIAQRCLRIVFGGIGEHRRRRRPIALPRGVDGKGLPFGLQLVGRFGGDIELLNTAQALEQAYAGITGLGRPVPDAAALTTPRPELKSIVTAVPG